MAWCGRMSAGWGVDDTDRCDDGERCPICGDRRPHRYHATFGLPGDGVVYPCFERADIDGIAREEGRMTSELTCYGVSPCVECAACRERDEEVERLRVGENDWQAALWAAQELRDEARVEVERLRAALARETWRIEMALGDLNRGDTTTARYHLTTMDAPYGGDA